jgi:hypothetical protein
VKVLQVFQQSIETGICERKIISSRHLSKIRSLHSLLSIYSHNLRLQGQPFLSVTKVTMLKNMGLTSCPSSISSRAFAGGYPFEISIQFSCPSHHPRQINQMRRKRKVSVFPSSWLCNDPITPWHHTIALRHFFHCSITPGKDGSGHGGMEVVARGAEAHGPPADRGAGQVGTETM